VGPPPGRRDCRQDLQGGGLSDQRVRPFGWGGLIEVGKQILGVHERVLRSRISVNMGVVVQEPQVWLILAGHQYTVYHAK
jgi:hypothetical protein